MSLIKVVLDEARQECVECDGMGMRLVLNSTRHPLPRVFCHDCHGRGWTLTEMGQLLIETLGVGLSGDYATHDHTHTVH